MVTIEHVSKVQEVVRENIKNLNPFLQNKYNPALSPWLVRVILEASDDIREGGNDGEDTTK